MDTKTVRLFLFPHNVLPEPAARCFLTVWPSMDCLKAIEPASVPEWAESRCAQHRLKENENFWDRVRAVWQGYRDLGSKVGEDGLMTVLSRDWILDAAPESRSHIQSVLRGVRPEPQKMDEWLLMEAAVFLELGRELDLRELELSKNLEHVGRLEENLLKALGADEEDTVELQKALETTNPPLSPDWGHLTYLLRQRIGYWFRVLSRIEIPGCRAVLAALSRDVVEEALDPVQTERERRREAWDRGEMLLLTCPRVDLLGPEDFSRWLKSLGTLLERDRFRESFEAFAQDPARDAFIGEILQRARDFESALKKLWSQFGGDPRDIRGYRCMLTAPLGVACTELWRAVDRAGAQTLGTVSFDPDPAVIVHWEAA